MLGERDLAEVLIFEGANAAEYGQQGRLDRAVQALDGIRARGASARTATATAISGCLATALRSAWEGGWQPGDIVMAAERRLGGRPVILARQLIGADAPGSDVDVPAAWATQVGQVAIGSRWEALHYDGSVALQAAAELLGMLIHLPRLPHLIPPPSRWSESGGHRIQRPPRPGDGRMLARVRALLGKAESTEFEEEAAALTAKAQELMARYAIDQAMLAGDPVSDTPSGRRVWIDDPYAGAKSRLLSAVASANRCRTVWTKQFAFSTVFGFSADLDNVDVLYTSLLMQANRAMTGAGTVRDGAGRSRTRSFRHSFLLAFVARIGERLLVAATLATDQAGAAHGDALLPVLAGRDAAVEGARATAFPHLVSMRVAISNRAGWLAGRQAADRARLGYEELSSGRAG